MTCFTLSVQVDEPFSPLAIEYGMSAVLIRSMVASYDCPRNFQQHHLQA